MGSARNCSRWFETIKARPAAERAYAFTQKINPKQGVPMGEDEKKILLGQGVHTVTA